jgi:hypothetical protein
VGLALQTWPLQPLVADAESAPHVVNFASQRLLQSAAEAGVLEPDVPDVPDDEPLVDDEHAGSAYAQAARVTTTNKEEVVLMFRSLSDQSSTVIS